MSAVPPGGDTPRPTSRLRRIDDALVPRLQRGARPVGWLLSLPGRLLRELDRRVAGGRPARAVTEHRSLVAFVVVGLMFGAIAVHAQRYPVLQERARQQSENRGGPVASEDVVPGGDNDAEPVGAVGPLVGAQVDPYLASRAEVLATAPEGEDRVAIVSFAGFLEPAEARELLEDLEVHLVQYRLPERTPRPAEVDVAEEGLVTTLQREIAELVTGLRAEEEEVASTLESGVEDESFRADYEARLDELGALRNTLTSDPAIVFGAVVTGPVGELRSLADAPDVRVVDLAPTGTDVAATTFYAVLPTDGARFSFGRGV